MNSAGAKSVISNDMQEVTESKEEISNRIRGHKANLSNPNTSEASKEASRKAIEELGGEDNMYGKQGTPISKSAADELQGSRVATA